MANDLYISTLIPLTKRLIFYTTEKQCIISFSSNHKLTLKAPLRFTYRIFCKSKSLFRPIKTKSNQIHNSKDANGFFFTFY